MNDYEMIADSYKILIEQGKIDKDTAEKEIRIYDFLGTCDIDDLCRLVNSAAFNGIIMAYCKLAVKNADIGDKEQDKILSQFPWIFEEYTAKEVLKVK
jgi:hypothetical protein